MLNRIRRRLWMSIVTVPTLVLSGFLAVITPQSSMVSYRQGISADVTYTASNVALTSIGTANLSTAELASPSGAPVFGSQRAINFPFGKAPAAGTATHSGNLIVSGKYAIVNKNLPGEIGFNGISGSQQAATKGGFDLEPPDQGTCAGPLPNGSPVTMEIINNALSAYTPTGQQLLPTTASALLFAQAPGTFMSDPRCYYDSSTQRWFFTEFTFGVPAEQYIAVSQTNNPLGMYGVFGINTTDVSNTTGNCPCFGDFDMIGANANGFYITTNEFSNVNFQFNGTVMYAISKQELVSAADGGSLPSVARYQITGDAFGSGVNNGPYHIAPASTPVGGSYAPNTEYFVESNSDQSSDNHLIVYMLNGTNTLASSMIPTLQAVEIGTEGYAFPPNATQKAGPIPLGSSYGATVPSTLQADFNAIQEVTYTNGLLYAEMDTALGRVTSRDAIGWFIISPSVTGALSARLISQGYISSSQNLLYPDIVVDPNGSGYMTFSISGTSEYPSPAYMVFRTKAGPAGDIHLATMGTAPEDGFTCYPQLGGTGCRWGDYSAGAYFGGRIYMMTEYIPSSPRDTYTNWGTYVWSLPSA